MKNATVIGELIRERREKKGLSQTQLAAKCDCTAETIRNIEDGRTGVPVMLAAICELGIKLGEL